LAFWFYEPLFFGVKSITSYKSLAFFDDSIGFRMYKQNYPWILKFESDEATAADATKRDFSVRFPTLKGPF
jgi:hypothetical protein